MARRVRFITDDMQRWDTIAAWNGPAAKYSQTPAVDALAPDGIQYSDLLNRPQVRPAPEPGALI